MEEQIEELEKLKYFDIDGLITVGTPSSDELNEKLKEISESGIPVVLVDTDAKESGRDAYVGTDNYRAGRLAAQMIAEEMNGEGDCLIILTKVENANQAERYDGFAEGLKDQGMALGAYLEMTGDKLALQEGLEKALEENPAIRGIFCAESSSSRRLWPILQQMGREDLTVIGFDNANATLQFVRNGSYAGTIVQSAREIGYESIRFLEDYKEGGEQKTIYTPAVYLTAETIEEE